jgi:RimJ/RimL family protein N-acetyltransferase
MSNYIIKTDRLGLRNWQEKDIIPAARMNADKAVREFFPSTMSQLETETFIKSMQQHFATHEYCYFAVDELTTNEFIGFIGLSNQTFKSDFTPCVDIGWRLLPEFWGKGYATEGALACVNFAFTILKLKEVYAIAPELNLKSQHVMQKIGMSEYMNFVHPKIDKGNPLKNCVAYRILESNAKFNKNDSL